MLGWFGVEVISNYGLLLWILGLPLDRFSTLIRDRRLCWWSAGFSFHYLRLTFTGRSSFEQMLQSANQRDEINVERMLTEAPTIRGPRAPPRVDQRPYTRQKIRNATPIVRRRMKER